MDRCRNGKEPVLSRLRTEYQSPFSPLLHSCGDPPPPKTMTLTAPDEETPLLSDQQVSAMGRSEANAATLISPLNQSGRTVSIEGRTDANEGSQSDIVKKTPLPWAQLSIVLFMLLAEYLTVQVISPVRPSVYFCYLSLWHCFTSALNNLFHSLHLRSVRVTLRICGIDKLTPGGTFM